MQPSSPVSRCGSRRRRRCGRALFACQVVATILLPVPAVSRFLSWRIHVMRRALWLALPVLAVSLSVCRGGGPDNVLDKAPSKFAKSGDLKVHYKSLGDGKTAVVFIHGWCCDLSVWREQAAAFDGKVRMLFVDLPGYGKSDQPRIDYTMDVFAKGIDAVLQDAGVEQAALAGHSMGTAVVRQYYRRFPKKTRALIFVDGALRPFSKDPADADKFMSMFKEETFKE